MTMLLNARAWSKQTAKIVSLRCPSCCQLGVWQSLDTDVLVRVASQSKMVFAGHRRCPNPSCQTHSFVVHDGSDVLISYPAETIDFDASNIPTSITNAFKEAITCHANRCFIASAILVRKTLEELCFDRRASGANLKEQIRDLGSKVLLPKEMFDGLDDIRLLGNDATHVKSQEYNQIGQAELDVAIEFTKEVLKAIFQYASLVDKLRALKKAP